MKIRMNRGWKLITTHVVIVFYSWMDGNIADNVKQCISATADPRRTLLWWGVQNSWADCLNFAGSHELPYKWWSAIPDSAVAEPRHALSHIPSQNLVHMFLDQFLTVFHRIFDVYNMYSPK